VRKDKNETEQQGNADREKRVRDPALFHSAGKTRQVATRHNPFRVGRDAVCDALLQVGERFRSPCASCGRNVTKPYLLSVLGLAFERKADAPSHWKQTKGNERVDYLESLRRLAKQVLSWRVRVNHAGFTGMAV
jgi:hypothetical protein